MRQGDSPYLLNNNFSHGRGVRGERWKLDVDIIFFFVNKVY